MKTLAILGAGESGVGAAILAQKKGYKVFVSDHQKIAEPYRNVLLEWGVDFEEGNHSLPELLKANEVVKSPGISNQLPIIKALQAAGIPIIDEIELAGRYTKAFLIGITGSNGKSTTTHLTYHLLKKAGFNVAMAGNMGESFAKKVALEQYDYYVLELSSFQLENIHASTLPTTGFKLNIACILNITADHLDRYDNDKERYITAKLRILNNLTKDGIYIYNADDKELCNRLTDIPKHLRRYPLSTKEKTETGAYLDLESSGLYFKGQLNDENLARIPIQSIPLAGNHNYYNAMAAISINLLLGVPPSKIVTSLRSFKSLPHRLAWVGSTNDIDFYNDSKATNVASALVALQSFDKPIIWIAGGYDKGNDYTPLYDIVKKKVKTIILLGKDNTEIKKAFAGSGIPMYELQSIQLVVDMCTRIGQPGEIALLSPACASFDLFRNFEDRGEQFTKAVKEAMKRYVF